MFTIISCSCRVHGSTMSSTVLVKIKNILLRECARIYYYYFHTSKCGCGGGLCLRENCAVCRRICMQLILWAQQRLARCTVYRETTRWERNTNRINWCTISSGGGHEEIYVLYGSFIQIRTCCVWSGIHVSRLFVSVCVWHRLSHDWTHKLYIFSVCVCLCEYYHKDKSFFQLNAVRCCRRLSTTFLRQNAGLKGSAHKCTPLREITAVHSSFVVWRRCVACVQCCILKNRSNFTTLLHASGINLSESGSVVFWTNL